jgi:hypothetical protein
MWSDIVGRDSSFSMGNGSVHHRGLANPQASSLIGFTPAPAARPALKMTCWYANRNVLPNQSLHSPIRVGSSPVTCVRIQNHAGCPAWKYCIFDAANEGTLLMTLF